MLLTAMVVSYVNNYVKNGKENNRCHFIRSTAGYSEQKKRNF